MIFSVLPFLFLFVIYTLGVSPSVYGGDSGDIILAFWFGGVAHAPGYPLNTMLGWVFTHLPFDATVAYKANLMAAFLMAASCAVTFLILNRLTRNIYASLAAALVLAFTHLFWLYAHVIEVFQLNLLLVSTSLYFLVSWRDSKLSKKPKDSFLNLSFLFLGLSVFHHHTSALIAPAFLYLILKTDKKILNKRKLILKVLGFFALGFLPYLFIPLAAIRQTPINWDDPVTVKNFLRLVTRADYGTFVAAVQLYGTELKSRFIQVVDFFLFAKSDFSILGLFFIAVGAVYTYLKDRKIFYFLLLAVLFTGPFFLFYASFPLVNDFYFGLWERFVLLPYLILSIYLGFGFKVVFNLICSIWQKKLKVNFLSNSSRDLLVGGLLLLVPFYFMLTNKAKVDLSNFLIGDWVGYDTLASASKNSIILIFNDTMTFNTQYVYYTKNVEDDKKLILAGQLRHLEYRHQVMRFYKELNYPDDFLNSDESDSSRYIILFINANKDTFAIYSSDYFPEVSGYKWTTVGLLRKLIKTEDFSKDLLKHANEDVYNQFKYRDFAQGLGYSQYMTSHIQEIYYRYLIMVADEMLENDMQADALPYLEKALYLVPDAKEVLVRRGNIAIQSKDCREALDNFERAFAIDGKDWRLSEIIASIYGECLKDEANSSKYQDIAKGLKEKSGSLNTID